MRGWMDFAPLPCLPMFSVTFSNRCETLLDALLARQETVREQGPFARAQILVPGSALKRRIELAMADRFGISAGVDFDYLAHWLWKQAARVIQVPEASPFEPDALVWRLFAALEEGGLEAHPRLARYLESGDMRQRFELAGRLARLFDHYLCYRPTWAEAWAKGESVLGGRGGNPGADEAWQAALWRRVLGNAQTFELPFLRFLRHVAQRGDAALAGAGLPASVDILYLPSLPPLYLAVLRTLARTVDVHLYVLNPCREYWFDIVDSRRLSWLARQQRDLFHETGNKLLAAWGKQTQAQIESLLEGENPGLEYAEFTPHVGSHLLAQLQNAILDLREPGAGSFRQEKGDRSIELHLCHSRIREVEALHDRLLALFRDCRDLRPEDVAVLTPDLASCAPLVEAVFGTAPKERFIPWHITGLGQTAENPVARVLEDVLVLAAGKMPASRVFDLLRQPLVAAHFGLDDPALEHVRGWIMDSGIRWGMDAGQASAAGAGGGHTVEAGMGRLFLSWAAGDAGNRAIFAGQTGLPHAPQGSAGLTLGAFWHYARALGVLRPKLLQAHRAEGWRTVLMETLSALVGEAPEHAEELRSVRDAINGLADDMAAGLGQGDAVLPPEVIRLALGERLAGNARGAVPGGAVTFSALPLLRGLPYRVICIIGLDYDAFPPREHADEFDLMAAFPQKGDRQRRDDGRNLFLDAVLAARDVLHLSCVGRSARDNAELPPSVLVDELLDTLALALAERPEWPDSVAQARKRLVVEHPLQSFSPAYFVEGGGQDTRLENFRAEFAKALAERSRPQPELPAQKRLAETRTDTPDDDEGEDSEDFEEEDSGGKLFFTRILPPPSVDWNCVDLAQLKNFFANPCRFLLRERLGLELLEKEEELADAEVFVAERTNRNALASRLLPVLLDEEGSGASELLTDGDLLALAQAGGEYPAGNLGAGALAHELRALRGFARRVNAACASPLRPVHAAKLAFSADGDGRACELRGTFGTLREDGHLRYRYDESRAGDVLDAWLDHLALCASPPPDMVCRTRSLSRGGEFLLRPMLAAEAHAQLEKLLALYRAGLREPLRFFPKSAWEYAKTLARDHNETKARNEAIKKWKGGGRYSDHSENKHPAYHLALRGLSAEEVLDEQFWANAEAVFGAIWAVYEETASLPA